MKKLSLLLIILISKLNGQINLVGNPGLQDGTSTPQCAVDCHLLLSSEPYWNQAQWKPNQCWPCQNSCNGGCSGWEGCKTADLWGTNCGACNYVNTAKVCPILSSKWAGFSDGDGTYKDGEGIRVETINPLSAGTKYTLRFKFATGTDQNSFDLYFTKFGQHWSANPNHTQNQRQKIGTYGGPWLFPNNNFQTNVWTSCQIPIEIDASNNDIKNVVFYGNNGYIHIDDVELFQGGCNEDFFIENKNYSYYEAPFEGKNIWAGYDASVPNMAGDVNVLANGGDVIYKGSESVTLLDGFLAQAGSEFHAFIAPCGSFCPPPTMPGSDYIICDGLPISIGASAQPNLNYNWTATSASDLLYLSSASVSNPVFTPPAGVGTITYTVTVSNNCGGSSTIPVTISYSDVSDPNPSVTLSNIDVSSDYVNFDVSCNPNTYFVSIQITDAGGNPTYEYELYNGIDFTSIPFHWQIPDALRNCDTYIVNVFSQNFCNTNVSPIQTFTWSKNVAITAIVPNIITPSPGGTGPNNQFCITFTGASNFDFNVFAPGGGLLLFSGTGSIAPPSACIWSGECNQNAGLTCNPPNTVSLADGTYSFVLDLWSGACQNKFSVPGFVTVLNSQYRIFMQDDNGSFRNLISSITLKPNPANDFIEISDFYNRIERIDIQDVRMQKLLSQKVVQQTTSVNIATLSAGLYFASVYDKNGNLIESKKFVKEN